jgi:hypothetical protein
VGVDRLVPAGSNQSCGGSFSDTRRSSRAPCTGIRSDCVAGPAGVLGPRISSPRVGAAPRPSGRLDLEYFGAPHDHLEAPAQPKYGGRHEHQPHNSGFGELHELPARTA